MKFTAKKIAHKERRNGRKTVIKTGRKTESVNSISRLEEHLHFPI
jgi:hypothetical protein